jgi:threonine/homoserine/homoserine lactone efflux protein
MEIYLLALGFTTGLSGVLIPGPLLVYTLSESLRRGFVGPVIISGHIFVEFGVVFLLTTGLSAFLESAFVQQLTRFVGGIALLFVAFYLFYFAIRKVEISIEKGRYAPFLGGVIFSAFNPTFPTWWVAIGAPIVFRSLQIAGISGIFLLMLGHWAGDLGWYSLISYTMAKTKKFLDLKKYRIILAGVGFAMFLIGIDFLISQK